jgi:hypothetical protein
MMPRAVRSLSASASWARWLWADAFLDVGRHLGEGAGKHADFAARIGRHGDRSVAVKALDGSGHLHKRPGERPRDQDRQDRRAQHRCQTGEHAGLTDDGGGGHQDGARHGLDDRRARSAGQPHPGHGDCGALAGGIRHQTGRRRCIRREGRGELRELALPAVRCPELECKFSLLVGMDQIITPLVHHIDCGAEASRSHLLEDRPHVDIDDDDPDRLSVRAMDRRANAQHRHMRHLDDAVFLIELHGRDIDLISRQSDRGLEIRPVAFPLQLALRHNANGTVATRAVDSHDFAPAVAEADDAELEIGGLGRELRHVARGHALPPGVLARAVDGIDSARQAGTNDAVHATADRKPTISARAPRT